MSNPPRNLGNGFVFVTSKPYDGAENAFVILGARENEYSHTGMEYVTGVTDSFLPGAGWNWGHYILDFDEAVEDFNAR